MEQLQRIGALRDRVRIERRMRVSDGDGAGNFEEGWETLIFSRAARISPTRGGEEVQAGRLAGVEGFDVWIRADPETRQIAHGDRIVDTRDESRIFAIRSIRNPDGRARFILLQCEAGGAD